MALPPPLNTLFKHESLCFLQSPLIGTKCIMCFRLDFLVRTGFLMFLFAAGLVVSFMETINSAINSKEIKRVSIYWYKLCKKVCEITFSLLCQLLSMNHDQQESVKISEQFFVCRLYDYLLSAQTLHTRVQYVQLFRLLQAQTHFNKVQDKIK